MNGEDDSDVVVHWVIDERQAELAALELWDRGATAVEVREGSAGPDVTLVASYPTPRAARAVAAQLGASIESVPATWRDAWKAHAEPVEVGDALVVVPAWRPVRVAGSRLVIEIDPGPLFGSGSHASTRLVLRLLADTPPAGQSVVDVGTGSGILAVAAARLGAATVTAVDVDPAAVTVTTANARRNGVAGIITAATTPVSDLAASIDGQPLAYRAASIDDEPLVHRAASFDLALVNVTAGVHAELAGAVVNLVRPGGRLYLAGLLPGQWVHVAPAYDGCHVVELPELDGWVGAVLERA